MKEQLVAFIENLKTDSSISSFDEAATKQIILNLLSLLGWSTYKRDEVWLEYSVGGKRVDCSLRTNNSNKVFLEAKRVNEELENSKHQEQLLGYSFQEGVKLAILTNGVTWGFYLPLREGSWERRKFYTIDIYQQEAEGIAYKFIDFLAKENVATGKAIENAEAIYKSQQKQNILQETIPKAWNKIITEPDELLVELINETTEKLCGYKADNKMIAQFLSSNKDRFCVAGETQSKETPSYVRGIKSTPEPSPRGKRPGKTFIKPRRFSFQGRSYDVRNLYEILVKVCEIIYEEDGDKFRKVALRLERPRSQFTHRFSYNKRELAEAKPVGKSGIYVDTKINKANMSKVWSKLLAEFGYSEKDLQIEYR